MSGRIRLFAGIVAAVLACGTFTLQAEVTPRQLERYRIAAEKGSAGAQYNLGLCYENGQGVTKDRKQAIYWYRKAAAQGDGYSSQKAKEALKRLGGDRAESPKPSGRRKTHKAVNSLNMENLRAAAENGDAEAQFRLYNIYGGSEKIEGVQKDTKQEIFWLRKAAENGHAEAQYNLSIKYEWGLGMPEDHRLMIHWRRKAAEQGYASAQFILGYNYKNGKGVPKNPRQAAYWFRKAAASFRKAAEQGQARDQLSLGICYKEGSGVPQNYRQAAYWFRKAAKQGNVSAQLELGKCYEHGNGVTKNLDQAVYWYRKAANQNEYPFSQDAKKILHRLGY